MIRTLAPRTVGLMVLLVAFAASGCGSEEKLVPAEGVLKIGGKPAANVSIQFMPDAPNGKGGPTSSGRTDAEGRFKLKTNDGRDGAVPGPHTVILADLDEERPAQGQPMKNPPRLDAKYTTAAGGLKAEVKEGTPIELDVPGRAR